MKRIILFLIMATVTIYGAMAFDYHLAYAGINVTGGPGDQMVNVSVWDAQTGGNLLFQENKTVTIYGNFYSDFVNMTLSDYNQTIWVQVEIGANDYDRFKYTPALQAMYCEILDGYNATDLLDNTDNQTLSYDTVNDIISIAGGNQIDITEVDTDTTYSESDKYLTLVSEVFGFDESELNTTIIQLASEYENDTITTDTIWSINSTQLMNSTGYLTINDAYVTSVCELTDTDTDISGFLGVNTSVLRNESGNIGINQTFFDTNYLDNTDAQTISFSNGNLTITGSNDQANITAMTCLAAEDLYCNDCIGGTEIDESTLIGIDTDISGFSGVNTSVLRNESGNIGINQTFFDTNYLDNTDTDVSGFLGVNVSVLRNESGNIGINRSFFDSVYLDDTTIPDTDSNISVTSIDVQKSGSTFTFHIEQENQDGVNLTNLTTTFEDADTTYSSLSEFTDDVGFYHTKANLTELLDDNYADISVVDTDTNESGRFDNLTGTDCGAGRVMTGVNDTGGVVCTADVGTDQTISFSNGNLTISGNDDEANITDMTVTAAKDLLCSDCIGGDEIDESTLVGIDTDISGFSGVNTSVLRNESGYIGLNRSFFDATYLDDTTIPDTDSNISVTSMQFHKDGSVFTLHLEQKDANGVNLTNITATFTDATGSGGNSTTQIRDAINNSGDYNINITGELGGYTAAELLDNTDAQTISFTNGNLTITGSNDQANITSMTCLASTDLYCTDCIGATEIDESTIATGDLNDDDTFIAELDLDTFSELQTQIADEVLIYNNSGTWNLTINCSSIVFDTGQGASAICDGVDANDGGSDISGFLGVNTSVLRNESGNVGINQTFFDTNYLDNTDAQTLSYSNGNITITGSNDQVNISGVLTNHAADNDAHHDLVTITGQDYLTLSTQQITMGEIEPDDLAASDFGDFSCDGDTCTLDSTYITNDTGDYNINITGEISGYTAAELLDNTDAQTVSFSNGNITISGSSDEANITDMTVASARDLLCTDCIGGTEIAELADADISNTLTCSVLTDDDTYATTASAETFDEDITFAKDVIIDLNINLTDSSNIHFNQSNEFPKIYANSSGCIITEVASGSKIAVCP